MSVWVDPRDGSFDLVGYFPSGYAELTQLNSADVMGVGNGPSGSLMWGVEIKKLSDTLQSLQSGRLVEQIGKMHEDYDLKFFLLEADIRAHPKTGRLQHRVRKAYQEDKEYEFWADAIFGNSQKMQYTHFMSWLMSICLCSNTYFLRSTSREDTVAMVTAIEHELGKDYGSHSSLKVFNDSQSPGIFIPSTTMKVARNLAWGVGYEKAALLAEHFGTPKAIINASVSELKEVHGIDTVLAERIHKGANEPHVLRQRTRTVKEPKLTIKKGKKKNG